MDDLLAGGEYGLLVENDVAAYRTLMSELSELDALRSIERRILQALDDGTLQRRGAVMSWEESAAMLAIVVRNVIAATRPHGRDR